MQRRTTHRDVENGSVKIGSVNVKDIAKEELMDTVIGERGVYLSGGGRSDRCPVVGYNIGAGRKDRAKALFTRLLTAEAVVGAVALLIVELFPRQLIGIFGAANESVYYTEYAVKCFRIYLCMTVLATVNKGTFIYLQSLGKAFASTAISMVQEVVFGVGLALLLPVWFGLNGVLYSMPVSDLLSADSIEHIFGIGNYLLDYRNRLQQ